MNILDQWTFPYEPRANQLTALEWLEKQDARYLLLEIPVGGGKSNLAITYSNWLRAKDKAQKASFIVTPQRILQEQYERSFKDMKLTCLYGKSNYICASKATTCDAGGLVKPKCTNCPHQQAKIQAREAEHAVLNYRLALTSFAYTQVFNKRHLLVFDECHSIEDHLVGFDALEITNRRCQRYAMKFKSQTKISEALDWIRSYYLPELKRQLSHLQVKYEGLRDKPGSSLTPGDIKKIRELDRFSEHVDDVEIMSVRKPEYIENNFVLVNSIDRFEFKRLSGSYSFNNICEPFADRFLFMSSTILDKNGFCEDIGINPRDAAMLSLGSEFPIENRPVYFMPAMRMNKSWNDDSNGGKRKKAIDDIKQVLEIHKSESGLIHTGNFAISKWLVENLTGKVSHKIFHHNPASETNRNDAINDFMKCSKPALLISPSSTEGLDLKEDLGRFAVFMKVPFGSLGDQWIRRKMEISGKWYKRRALIDMIQGSGRIVRSADDKGVVYILDESFAFLYKQSSAMVPRWWREAYKRV